MRQLGFNELLQCGVEGHRCLPECVRLVWRNFCASRTVRPLIATAQSQRTVDRDQLVSFAIMALNLFSRLMPAEEAFTPLFCEQAQRILQAALELRKMIAEEIPAEQHVAVIREVEKAADAVARRIFIAANRTFNAPIDREDILALAH